MIKKLSLIRILERRIFIITEKSNTHTIRPTLIMKDVSRGRNNWRGIMFKIR